MKLVLAGMGLALILVGGGCGVTTLWSKKEKTHQVPSSRYEDILGEAAAGDPRAQFSLAEMFRAGQGVQQNFAEAFAWYSIAAQNSHPAAQAQIRAGWTQVNITRGKALVEILKERYPNAVIP